MSGTFTRSLRSLRVSPLFSQYYRNFRLPVTYTVAKRHGTISAKSIGDNEFEIDSNGMTDKEIYDEIMGKYKTTARCLGLESGIYPPRWLGDTKDLYYPQQPADPNETSLPVERSLPDKTQQELITNDKARAKIDVSFSEIGMGILKQERGTMERALALLPEKTFHDNLSSVEQKLSDLVAQYEVVDAHYYDIDEYFKTSIFDMKLKDLKLFLQHTETFSEKTYAPEETVPIQDLTDTDAIIARVKKVLNKKFRVDDTGLADMFSHEVEKDELKIRCPGKISAHRTGAIVIELKDRKSGETRYAVTCSDVEMSANGSINPVDGSEATQFLSKGLYSGANYAFGGEAGLHTNAIGGSAFLRIYDEEDAVVTAITSRKEKGPLTDSTHLFVKDAISVDAAMQLIARILLIRDFPTGIYSDYPLLTAGSMPANNCGTVILEQKAIAGIKQNILALSIPTSPDGKIQIPIPKLDVTDPNYWILMALVYGLNAQYAVQWAEGVFKEVTSAHNVGLSPEALKDIKGFLNDLFLQAYYGLHAAAAWQEMFAEKDKVTDAETAAALKKLLTSQIGQLALLRPPTHLFNIVKATLAYEDYLGDNQEVMLDIIKTIREGVACLMRPSSPPSKGAVELFQQDEK